MATRRNDPTAGDIQGKIGNFVYYTRKGKECVRKAPVRSKPFTTAEQKNQNRFRLAADFARSVLSDPEQRSRYEKAALGTSATAQNVAVSDFMHSPVISEIDLSDYTGAAKEIIRIKVEEGRIGAAEVVVSVADRENTVLEEGPAELEADTVTWQYTARKDLAPDQPVTVTVKAQDQPGNRTTRSVRHTTGQ